MCVVQVRTKLFGRRATLAPPCPFLLCWRAAFLTKTHRHANEGGRHGDRIPLYAVRQVVADRRRDGGQAGEVPAVQRGDDHSGGRRRGPAASASAGREPLRRGPVAARRLGQPLSIAHPVRADWFGPTARRRHAHAVGPERYLQPHLGHLQGAMGDVPRRRCVGGSYQLRRQFPG